MKKRRNEIVIQETLLGGQLVKPVNQSLIHPKLPQPQAFPKFTIKSKISPGSAEGDTLQTKKRNTQQICTQTTKMLNV